MESHPTNGSHCGNLDVNETTSNPIFDPRVAGGDIGIGGDEEDSTSNDEFKATDINKGSKTGHSVGDWGNYLTLSSIDISNFPRSHLRKHLLARGLTSNGSHPRLVERLLSSIEAERSRIIVEERRKDEICSEHHALESKGGVYSIGTNHMGQLGLGDLDHREDGRFVAVPELRGVSISSLSTRNGTTIAVSVDSTVYSWGGAGVGPTGSAVPSKRVGFRSPKIISGMEGEGASKVSVGSDHVCVASSRGDLYTWGGGRNGCLIGFTSDSDGNDNCTNNGTESPRCIDSLGDDGVFVSTVSCGDSHVCALSNVGELFSWGHCGGGRLGTGDGLKCGPQPLYYPSPRQVELPPGVRMRIVSCGSQHTVAVSYDSRAYSWGSGDGGRLGHGDRRDRWIPTLIRFPNSRGRVSLSTLAAVIDASCGTWHSACVVKVRPQNGSDSSGWLYTWGSGLHGQLGICDKTGGGPGDGLNDDLWTVTTSNIPLVVDKLKEMCVSITKVVCGSHHNAALTSGGEMFTWGLNLNGCLGHRHCMTEKSKIFTREINDNDRVMKEGTDDRRKRFGCVAVPFVTQPAHCIGFNTIVDRVGKGHPRHVACGRGYTIVATGPYEGPSWEEVENLNTKNQIREEERLKEKKYHERQRILKEEKEAERRRRIERVNFLTGIRLCSICDECPGAYFYILILCGG